MSEYFFILKLDLHAKRGEMDKKKNVVSVSFDNKIKGIVSNLKNKYVYNVLVVSVKLFQFQFYL